jgi:hypothetical protein
VTDSALLTELLATPVGPQSPVPAPTVDFTRELRLSGSNATATIRDAVGRVNEGTALAYLESEGQRPEDWEVTGFRKVLYGNPEAPMESVTFTFRRKPEATTTERDLTELLAAIESYEPKVCTETGTYGYLVLLGDMQFGKADGDGPGGTLRRTIDCINAAADRLATYRQRYDIGPVHIGWLGDHIEGFAAQRGANAWRTTLTLTEQIRLTRRVMLHALTTFAPLTTELTMAAVPGNHGEAVRFNGGGITRYDDSHDTEALISVADAAALSGNFEHVKFYVPDTDALTVSVEVAGTRIAHAHGHQWSKHRHFSWWREQAFHDPTMAAAHVLVAGHLHHEFTEADGERLFIQVPALESESTYWKLQHGSPGSPGIITGITKDGRIDVREVVRA